MALELLITWEIKDKNGKITERTTKPANSIVRSLIDFLEAMFTQAATANGGIDTGGTTRTHYGTYYISTAAGAGNANFGIVLGTGTNAVAVTDTKLQTQIAHGNGSGQLYHGSQSYTAVATVGTTRKFTMQRTFTNNSGANITVNELGIYAFYPSIGWYFCFDRTLDTKTINNGSTGTVTYTIGVTV